MAELLARMRAVLRRKGGTAAPVLSNGVVSLDPATKEASVNGGSRATVQPRVLAAASLAGSAWGHPLAQRTGRSHLRLGEEVESNAVEYLIHALRRKLGSEVIKNVRGSDGWSQKTLNESVQLKLSFTLSLAILVVAIVAGVFSFLSAFDEAHELQDDVLRQVAQLMDRQRLSPAPPTTDVRLKDVDEESRVIVQRLGSQSLYGRRGCRRHAPAPGDLADGLHTLEVGGETFRVLVKTTAAGERIAVAQEAGFRNEIARDGALRTVMPFLILVPVLLLIVADLVRKMFRPIAALSKEIDQRAEQELHPVEDRHLPVEVRPFAVAINRLLARVGQSMESQRRFVADAAHELRSPLTALSLQAERLAEAEMSGVARERLTVCAKGSSAAEACWINS
jgi:hypothetical protein